MVRDRYQGENIIGIGKIDASEIEDYENQQSINGKTYSVDTEVMDPRSIVALEEVGVFQYGTYAKSILSFSEDRDKDVSTNALESMSDVEALNEGHIIDFPPRGPSQYRD